MLTEKSGTVINRVRGHWPEDDACGKIDLECNDLIAKGLLSLCDTTHPLLSVVLQR